MHSQAQEEGEGEGEGEGACKMQRQNAALPALAACFPPLGGMHQLQCAPGAHSWGLACMLMAVGVALERSRVRRNIGSGAVNTPSASAATTSPVSRAGWMIRRVASTPTVTRAGSREAPGPLQQAAAECGVSTAAGA